MLEVMMQPAYDLRKLESKIGDFQEYGLCIEKADSKPATIHSDLAVRRDSLHRARSWRAEWSGR